MGRHGAARSRPQVPWELVGWGVFACLVAAGTVRWLDGSWTSTLLVLGAGVVAIVALVLVSMSASSRRRRRPAP